MNSRLGKYPLLATDTEVNSCFSIFSVFTWRHDRHVGAPKQIKGDPVGAPTKSSENLTLLLCKRFLLFSLKNMAVDHVSENQQY